MRIKKFEFNRIESNFLGNLLLLFLITCNLILLIILINKEPIIISIVYIGLSISTLLYHLHAFIKIYYLFKNSEEIFIDEEKIYLIKKNGRNFDKINIKFDSIKKIIRLNDSEDERVYLEIMNNKDIKFLIMANREIFLIEYDDKIIKIGLGWNEEQIKLFLDIVISKNKNIIIERF